MTIWHYFRGFLIQKGKNQMAILNSLLQLLSNMRYKAFENIAENRENTGNKHFLLFPHKAFCCFQQIFQFFSCIYLVMLHCRTGPKFCGLVKQKPCK